MNANFSWESVSWAFSSFLRVWSQSDVCTITNFWLPEKSLVCALRTRFGLDIVKQQRAGEL
jgi:hypothetical protein